MTCNTASRLAVPRVELLRSGMHDHSDVDSTMVGDRSDQETVDGTISPSVPSPRIEATVADEEQETEELQCVVVRGTFLEVLDDGQCMMQRYRKMRKAKTDFASKAGTQDPEVYEPGRYSEEQESTRGYAGDTEEAPQMQPMPVEEERLQKKVARPRESAEASCKTTVMLRNLPNNYTRDMLLELLDERGMEGRYDFVYLPCDFYRDANLGYAFVNLVDRQAVDLVWKIFDGFSEWRLPTSKVCQVRWSGPHQGFKAHVERYRNSPVMHRAVPDIYKPVIFKDGMRKPFPRPTKRIKAPISGMW